MLNLCMNTLSGSVLRLSDHHGNETVKINTFFKPLFNKGHEEQCILFHSYVQYIHFSPVQPQSDLMDSEKPGGFRAPGGDKEGQHCFDPDLSLPNIKN